MTSGEYGHLLPPFFFFIQMWVPRRVGDKAIIRYSYKHRMTTTHNDDNHHRSKFPLSPYHSHSANINPPDNATTQEPQHDNTARRDTTLAMYYDMTDKTPWRRNDHTMMKNHSTTRHDSSHILRHDEQDITAAQRPHHSDATTTMRPLADAMATRLRPDQPTMSLFPLILIHLPMCFTCC
jgi:hypothetical protein